MLLEHWEVTVVIEMVVASRMTGRCSRWERWLPGSGGGLKVLNWNLHLFQLLEIILVLDSIILSQYPGSVVPLAMFY